VGALGLKGTLEFTSMKRRFYRRLGLILLMAVTTGILGMAVQELAFAQAVPNGDEGCRSFGCGSKGDEECGATCCCGPGCGHTSDFCYYR
jgi:hypothetical protein